MSKELAVIAQGLVNSRETARVRSFGTVPREHALKQIAEIDVLLREIMAISEAERDDKETLRDKLAGAAFVELIKMINDLDDFAPNEVAHEAYQYAAAMLAEKAKLTPEP